MAKKSKLPTESGATAPPLPSTALSGKADGGGNVAPDSGKEPVLTPDAAALLAEVRALRAQVEAQEKKAEKKLDKAAEAEIEAEITKEQLLGLETIAGAITGYNCYCGAAIEKGQKNCEACGGQLDWGAVE